MSLVRRYVYTTYVLFHHWHKVFRETLNTFPICAALVCVWTTMVAETRTLRPWRTVCSWRISTHTYASMAVHRLRSRQRRIGGVHVVCVRIVGEHKWNRIYEEHRASDTAACIYAARAPDFAANGELHSIQQLYTLTCSHLTRTHTCWRTRAPHSTTRIAE